MTDRELLAMAAKAIGTIYIDEESWDEGAGWNPLTDDGDALRLAVQCHIEIKLTRLKAVATKIEGQEPVTTPCEYEERGSAIRRAIVRAAAEIGKGME